MKAVARTLPFVLVLTAGYSSTSQEWVRLGVSDAQLSRDKNECPMNSHESMAGIQGLDFA